jgi:iron(II)-dependent oxidoreductase
VAVTACCRIGPVLVKNMRANPRTLIVAAIGVTSTLGLGVGWLWAYPPLVAGGSIGLGYVLLQWASGRLLPRRRAAWHGQTGWQERLVRAWNSTTFRQAACATRPEPEPEVKPAATPADPNDVGVLVAQMLAQGRYVLLLRPQIARNLNHRQLSRAMAALEEGMALVPDGEVVLGQIDEALNDSRLGEEEIVACEGRVIRVEHFFLDRYPVSNRQFYQFVAGGGYEQIALWDEKIWPAVLDFVDETGKPGPRFWRDGRYPPGLEDHPVVGVSWHEAVAFARWVGKRLASDAEWVKAGSWPVTLSQSMRAQRKYPWGDTMDRARANLWGSGPEGTVPVDEFPGGVSVGGVYQLIGNVWEWTRSDFASADLRHRDLVLEMPMKSIRGGAFDTYFDNQATCQFQSGEVAIGRKRNIGFRCAVGACDLMLARSTEDSREPAEAEAALVEEVHA